MRRWMTKQYYQKNQNQTKRKEKPQVCWHLHHAHMTKFHFVTVTCCLSLSHTLRPMLPLCSVPQEAAFWLRLTGSLASGFLGCIYPKGVTSRRSEVRTVEKSGNCSSAPGFSSALQPGHSTTTASRCCCVTPFLKLRFSLGAPCSPREDDGMASLPGEPLGASAPLAGSLARISQQSLHESLQHPSWGCHLCPPDRYPLLLSRGHRAGWLKAARVSNMRELPRTERFRGLENSPVWLCPSLAGCPAAQCRACRQLGGAACQKATSACHQCVPPVSGTESACQRSG